MVNITKTHLGLGCTYNNEAAGHRAEAVGKLVVTEQALPRWLLRKERERERGVDEWMGFLVPL
jgi:hypothetical protein